MATDLSKLIQESFTMTLSGLLAKDAKVLEISKAEVEDFQMTQLLKVDSLFDFTTLKSKFSFLVPAKTSSLIFNTMMGSPITDLASHFDADTEDAISEFISNTSGSLTTLINGSGFEDLGPAKFSIAKKEVLIGAVIPNADNTYKFKIDLEDNELEVYIQFGQELLDFIPDISKYDEVLMKKKADKLLQEQLKAEKEKEKQEEEEKKQEEIQIATQQEEITRIKKKKSMGKMIALLGSFLVILIVTFLVLFFLGYFEKEKEVKIPFDEKAAAKKAANVVDYSTLERVIWNSSDINRDRLNRKLSQLTKYEVLNDAEIEAQKLEEKNRRFEFEREQELIAFSKKNHDNIIFERKESESEVVIAKRTQFEDENFDFQEITSSKKEEATPNTQKQNILQVTERPTTVVKEIPLQQSYTSQSASEQNTIQDNTPKQATENVEEKLYYVATQSLKYSLFKSLVQETTTTQARISICNNTSGDTTIYIGPFETESLQTTMIQLVEKNDTTIEINRADLTQKEFNQRCNLQ